MSLIFGALVLISILGGFILSALSDLNAAVSQISTDVTAYIAAQAGAVAAADVEAAVTNINALDATVKAALNPTS